MLKPLWPLAAVLLFLSLSACGGDSPLSGGVLITPLATATPAAVPSERATLPPGDESTPAPGNDPAALTGFAYPIAGGCLPAGDQLMPNAPREYRNGVHEGVDMYGVDNCTEISQGTGVLAAKAGTVIRADLDYRDMTLEELNADLANPNTEEALDRFRGRQVWIQHTTSSQGVIVTRYAHLAGIAPGIQEGKQVNQGDLVGFVGESGTPESITNPGHEYHLHFEVRVGDSFLGAGLPPDQVRALYESAFGP